MFTRIRLLFFIALFGLGAQSAFAQIKIGDNQGNLDQNAVLEIETTNKGFLLPRITTAARLGMTAPVSPGMTVYDTDAKCTYIYRAGTGWYSLCSADSLSSSNGISLVGRDIQLGGKLTKKDTLTTVGTNTLTIAGDGTNNPLTVTNLQGGDQNDSIVTITAATGVVRKRTVADVLKATNADTLVWKIDGNTVDRLRTIGTKNAFDFPIITNNVERLRITSTGLVGIGTFTPNPNTTVTIAPITGTTDPLTLKGLNLATQTDSLLTADVNGVIHQIPVSTVVANGVLVENGISKTGNKIRLGGALNQPTTITTDATNTLALQGLQHGTGADSVVVSDATTGVLKRATVADIAAAGFTANNGLTKTNANVQLGGTLSIPNTTIATSATNTLSITGLQSGAATDSILTESGAGVVTRRTVADVINQSNEAWKTKGNAGTNEVTNFIGTTDNVGLVTRTNNVERLRVTAAGNLAIGTTTATSTVQLAGSLAVPIAVKTGNYSVIATDHTVIADCSSSPITLTLPDPATVTGRMYILVKGDNSVNLLNFGTYPIYLATATSISSVNYNVRLHIQSDGTKWWLIARF